MDIYGRGTETYLYLNGIKPREKLCLEDGVELQPSSCAPKPEEIISKTTNEMDIGVSCLFLRSVKACLHIVAGTPQELAVKAWNSQWDAILLGALYNCEIGFNFQCDVSPDEFSEANNFRVTNYHFKGLNAGKVRRLTQSEHAWLLAHYSSAHRLMDEDRFRNAVHCLASYRWHAVPRVQLALIWSGIEGLFQVDSELAFRVSLYIAKYLAPKSRSRQRAIFEEVRALYGIRSRAVHGSKLKFPDNSVLKSWKTLHRLVVKAAELGILPESEALCP
jgi:hypothetical protein